MKEKLLTGLLLFGLCLMMPFRVSAEEIDPDIAMGLPQAPMEEPMYDVYRLYNVNTGEHLYTDKAGEKQALVIAGWYDEGKAFTEKVMGEEMVYRLYSESTGDHHYATNPAEIAMLESLGWKNEGGLFMSAGDIPVYRLYNPNATGAGSHHYTANEAEVDNLTSAGWRYEDIGWFCESIPKTTEYDVLFTFDDFSFTESDNAVSVSKLKWDTPLADIKTYTAYKERPETQEIAQKLLDLYEQDYEGKILFTVKDAEEFSWIQEEKEKTFEDSYQTMIGIMQAFYTLFGGEELSDEELLELMNHEVEDEGLHFNSMDEYKAYMKEVFFLTYDNSIYVITNMAFL